MPEILTKHPDIVIELLTKMGAKCGQGEKQTILKKCPKESFCSVPGGELCVYGLDQIEQMTQFNKKDICASENNKSMFVYSSVVFILGFIFALILLRNKMR